MDPAVFLDRDGVIIENRARYVRSWNDVVFLPQALEALAGASSSPYKFVIVTNQSMVGRGLVPLTIAEEINLQVVSKIQQYGGRIDRVYICPHSPEDLCSCRKPQPGLLLKAAWELSLDLSHSIMIGDAISDLQAGRAAGVPTNVLLRTGRGASQAALPAAYSVAPFLTFENLQEALESLLL